MKQVLAFWLAAALAASPVAAQTAAVSLVNEPGARDAAAGSVAAGSVAVVATDAVVDGAATDAPAEVAPFAFILAEEVESLQQFRYVFRPVVVFSDSPDNPQFIEQLRLIEAAPQDLIDRDAVVIIDSDPAAMTAVRKELRPRGFSLVLMEKDGTVMLRKPRPWSVREITHAIDRFPLRRQEIQQQRPPGR
jgi:hypothetical protein